jgi:RNA polymerase sigma factor (TIGR02999 family)
MGELSDILRTNPEGDSSVASRLLPLVYDELRQLAAHKMARESGTQTLQPTALVHEAWLRLGGDDQTTWENRTHFFCAAAEAMRRILLGFIRQSRRAEPRIALKPGMD